MTVNYKTPLKYNMLQPDKVKLKSLKEEIVQLSANEAQLLKQHIANVIKAFNYNDMKVHGHLNELLLTINTDKLPETDNFSDIRKKLIYLIDTIVSEY